MPTTIASSRSFPTWRSSALLEFRVKFEEDEELNKLLIANLFHGMTMMNKVMMDAAPEKYPHCLGCGGIKYVEAPTCFVKSKSGVYKPMPWCQPVLAANLLVRKKKGTCLDLSCFLCALKWHHGDPSATILVDDQYDDYERPIRGKYHMTIRDGMGEDHDPQALAQSGLCEDHYQGAAPRTTLRQEQYQQPAPIGGS